MAEINKNLSTAVFILNNIDVKGKQNLLNMGGVIDLLESVMGELDSERDVPEPEQGG